VLDGEKAPERFYAAWEGQGGKVEYSRFRTYELSYIISLISVVAIAIGYFTWGHFRKLRERFT